MRLPPNTDVFEQIGIDTINDTLQIELRNAANTALVPYVVTRWYQGEDNLIDLDITYGNELEAGGTTTLDLDSDLRTGDEPYRATDYHISYFTDETFISYYIDNDVTGDLFGFNAPFNGVYE